MSKLKDIVEKCRAPYKPGDGFEYKNRLACELCNTLESLAIYSAAGAGSNYL